MFYQQDHLNISGIQCGNKYPISIKHSSRCNWWNNKTVNMWLYYMIVNSGLLWLELKAICKVTINHILSNFFYKKEMSDWEMLTGWNNCMLDTMLKLFIFISYIFSSSDEEKLYRKENIEKGRTWCSWTLRRSKSCV